MEITKVAEAPLKKNPHGVDARPIYMHPKSQVIILTLNPSESLKRHITPVDVFFYVLEGKGVVEIGDEKKEISKDTIVHNPKKNRALLAQQIRYHTKDFGCKNSKTNRSNNTTLVAFLNFN